MPALASRDIENKKQNAAAGDVTKKIVPEADVAMRSFDQAGNVGNRCAAIATKINDSDHRMKGGEGIGRDLWMRRGDFSEQGRLAGIWITDQSGVGHRSKLEKEVPLLTFFAFGVLDRRAIP